MIKEHDENTWLPKIIKAVASENKGIEEIAEEVERHKSFLIEKNLFQNKRQNQARIRIKEIVENKLKEKLWSEDRENLLNSSLQKVVLGNSSPYHIAEEILNQFVNKS